jgi:hypothetical protein
MRRGVLMRMLAEFAINRKMTRPRIDRIRLAAR